MLSPRKPGVQLLFFALVSAALGALWAVSWSELRRDWAASSDDLAVSHEMVAVVDRIAGDIERLAREDRLLTERSEVIELHRLQLAAVIRVLEPNSPTSVRDALHTIDRDAEALLSTLRAREKGTIAAPDFDAKRDELLLDIDVARIALRETELRDERWARGEKSTLRWLIGGSLIVVLLLLLALSTSLLRLPTNAESGYLRSRQPLTPDLSRALPYLADWILLCDADGQILRVLVSDPKAPATPGTINGRSLSSLASTLSGSRRDVLPAPGENVAVTMTEFGMDPATLHPVRLTVVRLGAGTDSPLLAIAVSRRDEVAFEESISALSAQLAKLQEDSESLRQKILYVAEEEQTRIGQDLHDGVGQQLAGIAFLSKSLADRLAGQDEKLSKDANWVAQLASQSMESVRGIARQLSSAQFNHGDLSSVLRQLCLDASALYGCNCRLIEPDRGERVLGLIDPVAARHLYRIAQEAINNALKHGEASQVFVHLGRVGQRLRLAVYDNGVGFDPVRFALGKHVGLGLSSMRVRAALLEGKLRIRTSARGTLVVFTAPMGRSLLPKAA